MWTAPEVLRGEGCTTKADVYSFDILLLELGPLFMGYEAQNQRSIALGPVPSDYQDMYSVALEAWNVITEALQPGNTHEDIVQAGQIIKKAGFRWFSPLVHWMHGGCPRDGSYIGHPNPKLSQVPVVNTLFRLFL